MKQKLIQTQKLIVTPQLRQYLKLLQLPILELQTALDQELSENPALEEDTQEGAEESISESDEAAAEQKTEELDFKEEFDQLEKLDEDFKESLYDHEQTTPGRVKDLEKIHDFRETSITKPPTLSDYLTWQMNLLDFAEEEKNIAQQLIGNINDDGYLSVDIGELSVQLNVPEEKIRSVLKILQGLEPAGVFSKDIKEALLIQLKRMDTDTSLAQEIVSKHLGLLEKKQFEDLSKILNKNIEDVGKACELISRLEPKPGRAFYSGGPITVVPDATVYKIDEGLEKYNIEINDEQLPRLRISRNYLKMLKDKNVDAKTKEFIRSKINSGLWLIKAIDQRKSTLRKITEEIVKTQKEFFDKGFSFLKPLKLKDIAVKIGIHESTVSRAVANKYIDTPQGTIPYKSFFSTKLKTAHGEDTSQKSIMEKIKKLIAEEDAKKPLSDSRIVKMLNTEGIQIARRTVAKYRETMKILPAHLRKQR